MKVIAAIRRLSDSQRMMLAMAGNTLILAAGVGLFIEQIAEHLEGIGHMAWVVAGGTMAGLVVFNALFLRFIGFTNAEALTRVQCLDGLANNVMIADENDVLVYMNKASANALRDVAPAVREVFKDFNPDKVMGTSIHQFHKDPARIKKVLHGLKDGEQHRAQIKLGSMTLSLNVGPIFSNGRRVGSYAEWRDITHQLLAEQQAAIMTSCLTNLKNNVMIADANDNLTYMNTASAEALEKLAPEIRKTFADFDPSQAMSASIHGFHRDPEAVKRVLRNLKEGQIHAANIKIGALTLSLNVGPIYKDGKRMGSYAEWRDVTEELRVKEQQERIQRLVSQASNMINDATRDIAQGNLNLSERTEAQAASIEETTATMQQVTERVNDNAVTAKKALELASTTRGAADRGGRVVKEAIEAMQEITASSEKINDIIGVIDEIAFQTNLLALNAAVEAARAGEQGRGFAVVAGEVRTLAGRSAKAAKEIKDLITESVAQIKGGTEQVNETGSCLSDIIQNVQAVTDMMNEISGASQEQATSISEINKSVAQMDSFTQQNAALVEEAASAAKALEEQSSNLVRIVRGENVDLADEASEAPASKHRGNGKVKKAASKEGAHAPAAHEMSGNESYGAEAHG